MNPPDPEREAGAAVTFAVTIDGAPVPGERIVSIETWSEVNRIPRARIVMFDGPDDADAAFPLSTAPTYLPGGEITIAAGYDAQLQTIHTGRIVRHSLRIDPDLAPQIVIETADALIGMTLTRNAAITLNKSDQEVIQALVAAAGGAIAKNEAAETPHEALVQYQASDWDMLLLRAEAGGCVVLVEAKQVSVVKPGGGDAVVRIGDGDGLIALDAVLDALAPFQHGAVRSSAWSHADQVIRQASPDAVSIRAPGDVGAAKLADVFACNPVLQQTPAPLEQAELVDWSTAVEMRATLAAVRGSARFQGAAAVKPGCVIALDSVGPRFGGSAFVTAVEHVIRNGAWYTTATFGMAADRFPSRAPDIAPPPAAGLAAPARGLHIGLVKQTAPDPAGAFRVLVTLPLIDAEKGVWARLPQAYASNGFGAMFCPEVNDEVVVGFLDEYPDHPIVLGSLYSRGRAPKYPPNEANDIKSLVTRSGIEMTFDDEKVIATIKTPKGRTLRLDDEKGEVELSDPFGNKLLMTSDKVDILSDKALNLTAKGDMTFKTDGTLRMTAQADFSASATNVALDARSELTAKATTSGSFDVSPGMIAITASLVKIN